MPLPDIWGESVLYIGGIIFVSFLVFWLMLFIFRRRNLNVSIRRSNNHLSRKTSVIVQLVISIIFTFCTIIILKQIYFLHHTNELGFSFHNRGSVILWETSGSDGVLSKQIEQIPEITETLDAGPVMDIIRPSLYTSYQIKTWDEQPVDAEELSLLNMTVSPEYFRFYNLRLAAGEMLTDDDPNTCIMLNESAVKAFGWHDPIGKHFDGFTVKGVLKNVYISPTIEAKPIIYKNKEDNKSLSIVISNQVYWIRVVLFKYQEGSWNACKEKIEKLIQKEYPDVISKSIVNSDEVFGNYLKSENALVRLLSFVSAICILICIFGFVSLVSLTCEERRKEIAIRKINGATKSNILSIFTKEYAMLLAIGSAIAFTTGYFIMNRWLDHYVKQTSIPAWIYLSITCAMALVIVVCVGWQVYKASIENPAEVVKSE